jgi:hypothetical protein
MSQQHLLVLMRQLLQALEVCPETVEELLHVAQYSCNREVIKIGKAIPVTGRGDP